MEVLVIAVLMLIAPSVRKLIDSVAFRTKAAGHAEIIRAKRGVGQCTATGTAARVKDAERRGAKG
jgi:hypothetical protein